MGEWHSLTDQVLNLESNCLLSRKSQEARQSNHWWFSHSPQSTAPQKRRPPVLVTMGKETCQLDAADRRNVRASTTQDNDSPNPSPFFTLINIILLNLSLNSICQRRADLCHARYNEGAVLWWLPGGRKSLDLRHLPLHGVNIHIVANSKLLAQCQEFTKTWKFSNWLSKSQKTPLSTSSPILKRTTKKLWYPPDMPEPPWILTYRIGFFCVFSLQTHIFSCLSYINILFSTALNIYVFIFFSNSVIDIIYTPV